MAALLLFVYQLNDSDAQRDKRLMRIKYFVHFYSLLNLYNIIIFVFCETKWFSYEIFSTYL